MTAVSMRTEIHVATKPSSLMVPSDVNTTLMKPVVDVTTCVVEYLPDSSASCCSCEQYTSEH